MEHDGRRPPQVAPRHPGLGPSKPAPTAGISQAEFTALTLKVTNLEKELQEALAEKNLWNTLLRKWQDEGKIITVELVSGKEVSGKIDWVDRYTIGLRTAKPDPIILHKGAIAIITSGS